MSAVESAYFPANQAFEAVPKHEEQSTIKHGLGVIACATAKGGYCESEPINTYASRYEISPETRNGHEFFRLYGSNHKKSIEFRGVLERWMNELDEAHGFTRGRE